MGEGISAAALTSELCGGEGAENARAEHTEGPTAKRTGAEEGKQADQQALRGRARKGGDPKKIPAHLHATPKMKYEAIAKYSQEFSVKKTCEVLGLAPQAYYQWRRRVAKGIEKREAEKGLVERVRVVFETNQRTYGYRSMQHALKEQGIVMSEYKLRRMMRENGLYPVDLVSVKVNYVEWLT